MMHAEGQYCMCVHVSPRTSLWLCRMCVHLQDGRLTDSLSTLWGHWQSDVKWPQHYLSLSRQFWVSSINPHPPSAEKHHLQFIGEGPWGREGVHQRGKKLPSVTEDWLWAKMTVLTGKYLPVKNPADPKENAPVTSRMCEIVAYLFQISNMLKDLRGAAKKIWTCRCRTLCCTQSNALGEPGNVGCCSFLNIIFA